MFTILDQMEKNDMMKILLRSIIQVQEVEEVDGHEEVFLLRVEMEEKMVVKFVISEEKEW